MYKVVEKFVSINGEGRKAGELSVFIRFQGCNLNCGYCDTSWANQEDCPVTRLTGQEILSYIRQTGIKNVTLTGGEPLRQENICELLTLLAQQRDLSVEIETNGSESIQPYDRMENRPSFTLDYKLPSSGMEQWMNCENYDHLCSKDTVKFVVGSVEDLNRAKEMIDAYCLAEKCQVYLSPVYQAIDPAVMVDYMKDHHMNGVRLQIQMHKVIWDPEKRGV